MNEIVGIGANVYDTLITLPKFPAEDTKLKANEIIKSGGGPCATGLVTASKLGASCAYIGTMSEDDGGKFLLEDFKKYNVNTEYVDVKSGFSSFCSFILLNEQNATRTCVFHKGNLPKVLLNSNQKKVLCGAKLLMVDGNELEAAIEGAKITKESGGKVLYDAGGLYEGVEKLLPLVDILIPSEEFALVFTKENSADNAAKKLYEMYRPEVVVITQGKDGGILYDGKNILPYPAFPVKAVDSNGAGDVFHGAFAFAVTKGMNYQNCCIFSSAVSALKCTKLGARGGAPSYNEVMKFLKEMDINEL